jgi:type II secretory pathway pseudopilin PulG
MAKHRLDKTHIVMIWVTAIVIILVASGITAVVLNNRFQTERDNSLAQQQAKQKQQAANQLKQQQFTNSLGLLDCKAQADKDYWSYVSLNATSSQQQSDGSTTYTTSTSVQNIANSQKQQAYSDCYKQYPTN